MTSANAILDQDSLTAVLIPNGLPNAAVGLAKNVMAQIRVSCPQLTLQSFKMNWYVGFTVPDNTDYVDSEAPVGSLYWLMTQSAGAITASKLYHKTAAGTWTVLGAES